MSILPNVGSGIFGALTYIAKLALIVPLAIVFLLGEVGLSNSNAVTYQSQYNQLEASLPAPEMIATYKCAGNSGDLEWQIWSVSTVSPGNSNPEVGEPPSIYTSPEFRLVLNGSQLFTTGGAQNIPIPGGTATTSFPTSQSTVTALTTLGRLLKPAASDGQPTVDLARACLVAHASDIAPLIQFENGKDQLGLAFRTSAPAGRTIGTKDSFPKTIPIPGPSTSGFLTVLPGQSATGTLDGEPVEFRVDPEAAPDVLPPYHVLVNGKDNTSSHVGNVMVQFVTQYGDGSVQWDIFYQ
jgi:hypothetical protein